MPADIKQNFLREISIPRNIMTEIKIRTQDKVALLENYWKRLKKIFYIKIWLHSSHIYRNY